MKRVQIKCITLPISKHSGLCAKIKPYKNRPQRLKIRADKQFPSKERVLRKSLWSVWKFQRAVKMCSDAQCEKQDVWLTPPRPALTPGRRSQLLTLLFVFFLFPFPLFVLVFHSTLCLSAGSPSPILCPLAFFLLSFLSLTLIWTQVIENLSYNMKTFHLLLFFLCNPGKYYLFLSLMVVLLTWHPALTLLSCPPL